MINISTYTFTIPGNGLVRQPMVAEDFKILQSTGLVDVRSSFGKVSGLGAGQGLKNTPFTYLEIYDASGAANTVKLVVGGGDQFVDSNSGSVSVSSNKMPVIAGVTETLATVTSAGGLARAANTGRSYLMIQNNDASGSVFLKFGSAATVGSFKIPPGGFLEMLAPCTDAIYMIGSIASNPNVVILEG